MKKEEVLTFEVEINESEDTLPMKSPKFVERNHFISTYAAINEDSIIRLSPE